jgi:cobalt-zinc-cadmium efflux system membrane fusion protein
MRTIYYVFGILLLLSSCTHKKHEEKIEESDEVNYRLDTIKYQNLEEELMLNGVVTFDEGLVDRVFPLVAGNVEAVNVTLGDYVVKGQNLASIISSDVSNYLNEYKIDKANFDLAKRKMETSEELYKSKFLSETELLTARKDFDNASDELKRSTQILSIYGGTENLDKPYFTVHSPITGYIVQKNINEGMELRADHSEPIFVISSLNKVWIMANVYEADIAQVRQGQEVEINTIVYPDKEFKGKISKIGSLLDPESKVLKVRIEMDNSQGLLKPDMFATIRLHINPSERFLAVPSKAVLFDKDKYFVIVKTNKNYEVREVKIIKDTPSLNFIKGNIKEGELVVTEGGLLLFNEIRNNR